jgi:FlaG/FlaF family flagellin (archaellin)
MSPQAAPGDPSTSATVVVGIVGAILVFAIIVGLQALFYNLETDTVAQIQQAAGPGELDRERTAQVERLHGYRWIDQKAGVVGIPIDEAMKLVVESGGEPATP